MGEMSAELSDAPVTVRPATAADFATVCPLLAELGRPEVTPETTAHARAVYERHVAAADTGSLVAERAGKVIGFLSLHFRERLCQPTIEAWVPDLIVTAEEQGRGAALALLSRAIELARQRGCYRLALESHYHRQRAHRFYLREGFTDAGKCFVMKL